MNDELERELMESDLVDLEFTDDDNAGTVEQREILRLRLSVIATEKQRDELQERIEKLRVRMYRARSLAEHYENVDPAFMRISSILSEDNNIE